MTEHPSVLLFDVNETLSDMAPMADRFAEVGASASLAETWFAGVLRDGFALAVGGVSAPFAEIGRLLLRSALTGTMLDRPLDEAIDHVMAGFTGLDVHPDVREGLPRLAAQGLRLVTLSNGAASVARGLLERSGLVAHVEATLTVDDAGIWKPARASYVHACERCGVEPGKAMMVAVHPWDIDGAARAGLRTCWIDRTGAPYPAYFSAPDVTAAGLDDLATQLARA